MRILTPKLGWDSLSETVRRELRTREHVSSTISVYRWWARRSHGLIGALLDRAIEVMGEDIVISDPMSGGGTVAVEAARRKLAVRAQDVNPWAAFGLRTLLTPVDPIALEDAVTRMLSSLAGYGHELYASPTIDGGEVVHRLHVRRIDCTNCGGHNFLYQTPLLAVDRRPSCDPKWAWYGCRACGAVTKGKWQKPPTRCKHCHYPITTKRNAPAIRNFSLDCAHCSTTITLTAEVLHQAEFIASLDQVLLGKETTFTPAVISSRPSLSGGLIGEKLDTPIPDGLETRALIRMGFRTWKSLYTARQLNLIEAALKLVPEVTNDRGIAQRIRLAIAGFGEMAGYASRWDPRFRKAYELTANHHYSRVYLAAEVNPLGAFGRGTLPRRLRKAVKAARWFPGARHATVRKGSSDRQLIPTHTVDLVITDPPYFDSVQYGELSQAFLAFGSACGLPVGGRWQQSREAVPNSTYGRSVADYRNMLGRIMRETARTLKPTGRVLLTFHNRKLLPWQFLADALREARLRVVGLAVVHSENELDHAKHGKGAMTSDLVIECVPADSPHPKVARICTRPKTNLEKNLAAVGYTVAAHALHPYQDFEARFLARLRSYRGTALIGRR